MDLVRRRCHSAGPRGIIRGVKAVLICTLFLTGAGRGERFRVWQVDNPLFDELLTDQATRHASRGCMVYVHGLGAVHYGLQYGVAVTSGDYYTRVNRYRLHPALGSPHIHARLPMLRRYGVRPIYDYMRHWRNAGKDGVPKDGRRGNPYIFDPRTTARIIRGTRADLKAFGEQLHGYQLDDEGIFFAAQQTMYFWKTHGGTGVYPFIDTCEKEVKEKFGFGKYGIPRDMKEHAPYKSIAFGRWVIHKALERAREIRGVIKAKHPDLVYISYDGQGAVSPWQFSLWGDVFDVIQKQILDYYPKRDMCRVGMQTKMVVDLSGAEFWPILHQHNGKDDGVPGYSTGELIELMSQVLRNGGTGLSVYMPDYRRSETGMTRKFCYYSEEFGAPSRWGVVAQTARIMSEMPRLRFPEPDFAVFYSNTSHMARNFPRALWRVGPHHYAYMILGQKLGGWFSFISDVQIDRNKVDLSRFKAIFVPPDADYVSRAVADAMHKYVAGGGTLISGDPAIWSSLDNGDSAASFRARTFGVSANPGGTRSVPKVARTDGGGVLGHPARSLPVKEVPFYKVTTTGDARVAARFDDGTPAVTIHAVGKGHAIYFAFNPFTETALRNDVWRAFFQTLCQRFGIRLNQDIWRFKIPMSKYRNLNIAVLDGTCLTGNHLVWSKSLPYAVKNLETGGSYMLKPAPTKIPDVAAGRIGFAAGKLTNRLKAPVVGNHELGYSKLSDWVVTWDNEAPVAIILDFRRGYEIGKVKVWHQGALPRSRVSVRMHERDTWAEVSKMAAMKLPGTAVYLEAEVRLTEFAFDAVNARFVKIDIGERPKGKPLTLSEVEVWTDRELVSKKLVSIVE